MSKKDEKKASIGSTAPVDLRFETTADQGKVCTAASAAHCVRRSSGQGGVVLASSCSHFSSCSHPLPSVPPPFPSPRPLPPSFLRPVPLCSHLLPRARLLCAAPCNRRRQLMWCVVVCVVVPQHCWTLFNEFLKCSRAAKKKSELADCNKKIFYAKAMCPNKWVRLPACMQAAAAWCRERVESGTANAGWS
jgi:hypothetical protein